MATSVPNYDPSQVNLRLCRLRVWPNYGGLGFNLENSVQPPHIIRTVESNSPAAIGGLRITDLVLAVNNQDVSQADYKVVTDAIKNARDNSNSIDLLVIEKRLYTPLKNRGVSFDPTSAKIFDTPTSMPKEFMNFPKYTPRTCEMRLSKSDQSFGFEVVNGPKDIGAFIQDVVPNTPASRTPLRRCDRILEIDDKFIDNEPCGSILEKLMRAKKKRSVKLYVVDTNTYKYFQEQRVPLGSKEFRKSKFAKGPPPSASTYINVQDISTEPRTPDIEVPRPIFPQPTLPDDQSTNRVENLTAQQPHQDDIRLCTINRASATDQYGMELSYQRRDQYHSLKLKPGRDSALSNAARAGVKTEDRLIEVNGENIETFSHEEVQQRMHAIKYPQPLQILVADTATYNHYKQENRRIHNGLPTVQKLPANTVQPPSSLISTPKETTVTTATTVTQRPVDELPTSGRTGLLNSTVTQSNISMENSISGNRRKYQLHRIPGSPGYGFSVNSNVTGGLAHKITQIAPNSPAAQQGLRVGDYILSVNDQNVRKMTGNEFNSFLRTSVQNVEANGNPLLIEVINEDSYQQSGIHDVSSTKGSITNPRSTITSTNENIVGQPLYYKPPEPVITRNESPKSIATTATQQSTSRQGSRTSISIQPRISPHESRKSTAVQPTAIHNEIRKPTTTSQPITSRDDSRKLTSTEPTVSRNESRKSTINLPTSSRNDAQKSVNTLPYTNGYDSSSNDHYSRPLMRPSATSLSSLYRSRAHLSRGAVDVVSEKRLLRYCRLSTQPGQSFGFQLKAENNKHILYNIQPDSPAARAGISENDRLIGLDDQDVEHKSNKEVANLLRNAGHNGTLRLFIAPNSIKVLSKRSTKSLSSINGDHSYRLKSNNLEQSSSRNKQRSTSRLNGEQNDSNNYSSEPTEPLPRKCVLQYDPSFRGCGFRLVEKENYDTPIIIEITPHSPAQRSGLTEGDHIIYIDSQNVQNFHSFEETISLIQRTFEENGHITLVTLTGPGYQVLKRRGGYLETATFDYQSSSIEQLKPRLCQLKLFNHEHDFGFTLNRNNYLHVKNIEQGSSADIYGLKKGDIILELNGKIAKNLTTNQIKQIIETSQQERQLDILVIDIDAYQFSTKHAIPLNSVLSVIQTKQQRATTTNNRIPHEPVYL